MNAKCIQEELKQQIADQKERDRQEKHNPFQTACCVKGEIFPIEKEENKFEKKARCSQYAQELIVIYKIFKYTKHIQKILII